MHSSLCENQEKGENEYHFSGMYDEYEFENIIFI